MDLSRTRYPALVVAELACFIVLRDHVRIAYLADSFNIHEIPVNEQWGMFGLFVAFLVGGLGFVIS